jgi:four helix bundle protein
MKDEARKPEDIRERAFKFALRVIKLCKELPKNEINRVLINQVLRSGTSIGANLEEALGAHTKAEFTNSTNIAKKEARETNYWLRLMAESNSLKIKKRMENLLSEAEEIIKILTSSVKKLKNT